MYASMTTNLMVENVEKSVEFYQEMLGFKTITTVPAKTDGLQFAIISKDNLMLMLQEKNNLIEEYPLLQTKIVHPSATLFISVTNFDELYKNMKDKSLINTEVHTTFYGTREFAVADKDGYILTFSEQKSE